jgi:hypothetical protein
MRFQVNSQNKKPTGITNSDTHHENMIISSHRGDNWLNENLKEHENLKKDLRT